MLLSEKLRALSKESIPSCIDDMYVEVESAFRNAAKNGFIGWEVDFSEISIPVMHGVIKRLEEQGFKVNKDPSNLAVINVSWG